MSIGISNGISKPRAVALATIAGALTLGFASGAFGTFSATLLSGYTCSAYGYFTGFGYGYDCTPNSGGGGGGGSSSYSPIVVTLPATSTGTVTPVVSTGSISPIAPLGIDGLPLRKVVAVDINRTKYKVALQTLVSNGLINNNTRVFPTRPITRGEFLKILARANGFVPVTVDKKFADVSSSDDLAQYIYFGVKMGWINTKNNNFRPNDRITQGEVTKLIRAIKGTATADTVASNTPSITRGKAAQDIVDAFFGN